MPTRQQDSQNRVATLLRTHEAAFIYVCTSMLDQNKDGSAMDDLQRLAANFLK